MVPVRLDPTLVEEVRQRALRRCEYCHLPAEVRNLAFQIDHIVARQHGGGDESSNLAFACERCNSHKGPNLSSIDPFAGEVVRLHDPRAHRWNDVFRVEDGLIVGRTPEGRATARLLRFNLPARVHHRRLLGAERDLWEELGGEASSA